MDLDEFMQTYNVKMRFRADQEMLYRAGNAKVVAYAVLRSEHRVRDSYAAPSSEIEAVQYVVVAFIAQLAARKEFIAVSNGMREVPSRVWQQIKETELMTLVPKGSMAKEFERAAFVDAL